MENLTEDQKTKITMEMLNAQPLQTVGQIALLKIAEMAVSANSEETTLSTEATFEGKRYKCKMVVTWELKSVDGRPTQNRLNPLF